MLQVGQKKGKYSTHHGRDQSNVNGRSGATTRRPDAGTSADNVIMIMADTHAPPSSSSPHGGGADGRTLDGGFDGPASSDTSSASSTGSQGAESDLPSERTSTTDVSSSLTSSFAPLTNSNDSRSNRSTTVPARPPRRHHPQLQRIISDSSC